MALIKCDECGREISDKSIFCPGCGYPTHLNKSYKGNVTEAADAFDALHQAVVSVDKNDDKVPIEESPTEEVSPQAEVVETAAGNDVVIQEADTVTDNDDSVKDTLPESEETPELLADSGMVADECEAEDENEYEYVETEEEAEERHRRNERGKLILLLVTFALLLAVAVVFYLMPKEGGDSTAGQEDVAVVVDSLETASDSTALDSALIPVDTVATVVPVAQPPKPVRRPVQETAPQRQTVPDEPTPRHEPVDASVDTHDQPPVSQPIPEQGE